MASVSVEEELQCPICLELLTDPVNLDCGHNFCRGCITNYCEKWENLGDLECPLCKAKMRKVNFQTNFLLANIVEKVKFLSLNAVKEPLCMRHKERLHLFCKEDKEFVCLFCERSPEHQSHTVLLLEEAAKEYKAKFQDHLKILVNEQEKILHLKEVAKEESLHMLKQVKKERKRAVTYFRQLQEYMQEQENLLLAQMDEVEDQLVTRRDERLSKLSEEFSSLESLIQEVQEKLCQPADELLKDVASTLQKYDTRSTLDNLEAFPDKLKFRIKSFYSINQYIETEMTRLKATLVLDPASVYTMFFLPEVSKSPHSKHFVFKNLSNCYPFDDELPQPSREDPVRREEDTYEHLSTKEKFQMYKNLWYRL